MSRTTSSTILTPGCAETKMRRPLGLRTVCASVPLMCTCTRQPTSRTPRASATLGAVEAFQHTGIAIMLFSRVHVEPIGGMLVCYASSMSHRWHASSPHGTMYSDIENVERGGMCMHHQLMITPVRKEKDAKAEATGKLRACSTYRSRTSTCSQGCEWRPNTKPATGNTTSS